MTTLTETCPCCNGRGGTGSSHGGVTISYRPCTVCDQEGVIEVDAPKPKRARICEVCAGAGVGCKHCNNQGVKHYEMDDFEFMEPYQPEDYK